MPRAFYNMNTNTDDSDITEEDIDDAPMEELTLSEFINTTDTGGKKISKVSDVDKPDENMSDTTLDNKHFWSELKIIKGNLENMDRVAMHKFVSSSMSNEIVELKNAFSAEFDHVPNDDSQKMEIVKLMESLGISVR